MKRFLLSTIMVVIGLSAFSQSPSRIISLQPAYPLVVGESTASGVTFDSNALSLTDTPLDSLPHYEIGQIFEQIVRCYTDEGHGFYVKADSLHSVNVTYSYEFAEGSEQPKGTIEFNPSTGRFKYFPAADDYKSFTITFTATNGTETITEDVLFGLMPRTPSEADAFHTEGTMPDAGDYVTRTESSTTMFLNNEERTVYCISIAGKDVVFDNSLQNKVWGLSGREDIYELNIYAERLIVRSALSFPQTNITIYAREIRFEDSGEEYASISTTPTALRTLTDGVGRHGANAGDINLYVKDFKGNMAMRFILNGAPGQSCNRNGTPGNGGNGGTLLSTIDVSSFCDFARGSCGVKYDVASNGSTQPGPIIAYGEIGREGKQQITGDANAFLHPYYIAAVIRHANDAFVNNFTDYTLQTCREYRNLISELLTYPVKDNNSESGTHEGEIDDLEPFGSRNDVMRASDGSGIDNTLEFQSELLEIEKMLFKLEQGLDYFGNSDGWVPLMSFEVMLANYKNEVDRAVPTLYMYYWLNCIDRTLQEKMSASQLAASETEKELDDNTELLNTLTLELPVLQNEAEAIAAMIEELTHRIEALQNQLMAQAVKNVKKRNRWNGLKNIFNIAKTVVSAIPVVGTAASAIGGVINTAMSFTNTLTSLNAVSNTATNPGFISTIKTQVNNIKTAVSQNNQAIKTAADNMEKAIDSVEGKIGDLKEALSKNVAPNSEIQAEYDRLIAGSAAWKSMMAEAEELNTRKTELLNHTNEVLNNMNTTMSQLTNDALALDAFRRDVFAGNSKRDLNAMLYLEQMKQRAKDRLLLYDYYLRKAYEYRILKPYTGEYNLMGMFERFQAIGEAGESAIDYDSYNSMKSIFDERITDMTEKILKECLAGNSEMSAPITIVIPREQLDIINADESLTLNFQEMGIFAPDEENVRIVNLNILHMDTHLDGAVGYSGYMDLNMTHSGISQFRKDGNMYWFDHMPRTGSSHHTWGTRYDAVSGKQTEIKPSAASTSLLYSILGSSDNTMLFSRPSAWSDITVSKKVHTSWGADVIIDSLVIELQYDFTRRPNTIRNIDVCASDGLLPYIACSEEDINGRSDGTGHLMRSFRATGQPITYTATEKYASYYFKNWADRAGRVYSDKPELTISNRSRDQFYIANYERRVPVLSICDTIYVSNSESRYTVDVKNIGEGGEEMDWYAADSICSFTKIEGETWGIDNGRFTIHCLANTSGKDRTDQIVVYAPETDEMSRIVYVVQSNTLRGDVDGDGRVSAVDVWTLMGIIARGGTTPEFPRADLNGDGRIDVADVMCVTAIVSKGGQ